jgi:hypothetical protein
VTSAAAGREVCESEAGWIRLRQNQLQKKKGAGRQLEALLLPWARSAAEQLSPGLCSARLSQTDTYQSNQPFTVSARDIHQVDARCVSLSLSLQMASAQRGIRANSLPL